MAENPKGLFIDGGLLIDGGGGLGGRGVTKAGNSLTTSLSEGCAAHASVVQGRTCRRAGVRARTEPIRQQPNAFFWF